MKIRYAFYLTKKFIKAHIGDILTVGVTVGTIAAPILAAKAMHEIDENSDKYDSTAEVVKNNWLKFVPTGLVVVGTNVCAWSARSYYSSLATAATAASLHLSHKYRDLRNKLIDMYGEDKVLEAEEEIVKDKAKKKDISKEPNDEKIRWYEPYSEQFFDASEKDIIKLELKCNKKLTGNYELTVNELLDLIPDKSVKLIAGGDTIGWFADNDWWCNTWSYLGNAGSPWLDISWKEIELDNSKVRCLVYNVTPDLYDYEYTADDPDFAPIEKGEEYGRNGD